MGYKKRTEADDSVSVLMSGYCDSNTGPSGPKPDALANCATPRMIPYSSEWDCKDMAFFMNGKIFCGFLTLFFREAVKNTTFGPLKPVWTGMVPLEICPK